MQWLFILVAAGWVILSVVSNKKRQQARAEAEKQAAQQRQQQAQQQAAQPAPQQRPARPNKPFSPFFSDEQEAGPQPARPSAPFSPFFPDVQEARPAQPQRPAQPPAARRQQPAQQGGLQQPPVARRLQPAQQGMQQAPATRMQTGPTSSLTELVQTQRHTLTPSGETGHAHQETSMTGFEPDCPPEADVWRAPAEASPAYAGMPVFSWRPSAVLNGMVYAEILAKPKALRG